MDLPLSTVITTRKTMTSLLSLCPFLRPICLLIHKIHFDPVTNLRILIQSVPHTQIIDLCENSKIKSEQANGLMHLHCKMKRNL